MDMLNQVGRAFAYVGGLLTGPKREFSCGDCERWERCGLPPSANCTARAEQIARDGDRRDMRDVVISSATGWIYGRR